MVAVGAVLAVSILAANAWFYISPPRMPFSWEVTAISRMYFLPAVWIASRYAGSVPPEGLEVYSDDLSEGEANEDA